MKKMYISLMLLFFTQYCLCMLKYRPPTPRPSFEDESTGLLPDVQSSRPTFPNIVTGTMLSNEPRSRSTVISPRDESDSQIPTVIPLSPPHSPLHDTESYSDYREASCRRLGCLAFAVLGSMGLIGLIMQQCLQH